jgi:hypothetical protein
MRRPWPTGGCGAKNTHKITNPLNQWRNSWVGPVNRLRVGHRRKCVELTEMTNRFILCWSFRTEYRAHYALIQWPTGTLSTLPAPPALPFDNVKNEWSYLATPPHVPTWSPKWQPFIALSFLRSYITVTYFDKITFFSFWSYGWE